jgi:hypothetical protein
MKNIINYFTFFILLIAVSSCFKTEDDQMQSFKEGAVLASITPINTVLIVSDLANSYSSFVLDTVEGDFSEIIVNANHRRLNKSGVLATYSSIPVGEVSFTASEIASALGLTLDSLESRDEIVFSITIKSKSGVSASSAASSFTSIVACPSDLAGTYSVVASGKSTDSGPTPDENPISGFTYEVTLTAINAYQYEISDFSGGLYFLWYDIYGIEGDSPGYIQDICGSLSYVNTFEPFGTEVIGDGSYDGSTGVIKISGENGYGDSWSLTLTPKE